MNETVLLASFKHESKTFDDELTTKADFSDRRELYGDEIPATLEGTNSEVGGIIDIARTEDIDLLYTVVANAQPGGLVERRTYEHYVEYILETVQTHNESLDGIIMPLHGAMIPEHLDDGEGPLVNQIKEIVGQTVPVVVTIDPNANISDGFVEGADAIIAFETTPHVDKGETGRTGIQLLIQAMRGDVNPVMHIERPPVIPSAVKSTTLEPPMTDIHSRARELEQRDEVLKVNVCQGFWPADIPHMGFSILVVSDDQPSIARDVARDLSKAVWDHRKGFVEPTFTVEEGISYAQDCIKDQGKEAGPVVVAEMHDNPGGGAPADGTKVLRALLEQKVTNAALATMCDPEAVQICVDAGVGKRVKLNLGGRTEPEIYGEPILELEGYVKTISDGRYPLTGPVMTGTEANIGRAVRFQCGIDDGIDLVIAEHRRQPYDGEVFRHVGILPERCDLIAVKSAVHYRADYGPMASEIISIDESPDFDYKRITRPRYPLDNMDADDYPDWTA